MSTVEIIEVESTSQLREFIACPNRLYKGDPNYVVPLTSERLDFFNFKKNPFYRGARARLFLALQNRRVVGRIATCVNFNHNEFHQEQTGFFGFLDCPDDYEIASTLLKVAMITLKKEGMDRMRGPMNFSTNHECGFLVNGFDSPPVVMMPYNLPYLPKLAERFGLSKVMDLLAYRLAKDDVTLERIFTVADRIQHRSRINLRSIRMSDYDNEARRINTVYRDAWEKNWGFVPMTDQEFYHAARQLKQIIDPNLTVIAEQDGKPVAFSLAVPNVNQALIHLNGHLLPLGLLKLLWHTKIRNKIDGCRIIMLGVVPEFRTRGIDSMLYTATYRRGIESGYTWAELSWILETNDMMRRGAERMGATLYKRYRIMEIPL